MRCCHLNELPNFSGDDGNLECKDELAAHTHTGKMGMVTVIGSRAGGIVRMVLSSGIDLSLNYFYLKKKKYLRNQCGFPTMT